MTLADSQRPPPKYMPLPRNPQQLAIVTACCQTCRHSGDSRCGLHFRKRPPRRGRKRFSAAIANANAWCPVWTEKLGLICTAEEARERVDQFIASIGIGPVDRTVCINLDRRPDRWAELLAEVAGVTDWPFPPVERFSAVDHLALPDSMPTWWGQRPTAQWPCSPSRQRACYLSHVAVLTESMRRGSVATLILEDDCCFRPDFARRFASFAAAVPSDWEILYLGGDVTPDVIPAPTAVNAAAFRLNGALRNHAYIVRGTAIPEILALMCDEAWQREQLVHVSDWFLMELGRTGRIVTYGPRPGWLAGQRAGRSNITGAIADRPEFFDCPKNQVAQRGIVICGGGQKYLPGTYANVQLLRSLGCTLPIEIWHIRQEEMPAEWGERLARYVGQGGAIRDAYLVADQLDRAGLVPRASAAMPVAATLYGYEAKLFALQWSAFTEVLSLDSDSYPTRDPSEVFDWPEYREHGACFWPDPPSSPRRTWCAVKRDTWQAFGVPDGEYREERECETGQILVDKNRCWPALSLCNWFMQNGRNWYNRFQLGDKDVPHLAWRKLRQEFAIPPIGPLTLNNPGGVRGCLIQLDFAGKPLFQHRLLYRRSVSHKLTLPAGSNRNLPGFLHEDRLLGFLKEIDAEASRP